MKKLMIVVSFVSLGLGLFAGEAFCGSRADDPLGIAVSPQTFILSMDQGGAVTVHTEIAYSSVDSASLKLNGIPVDWAHVDSRGHIVGEFNEEAVKAIVAEPQTVMTLTGNYKTGESFSGSDTVRVIP
jgi:hypothetical protein